MLEVFRLHPVFPILVREVASDIEINNFIFTEKAFVFFNTGKMHTDSFWGQDAELFRPERFLEKNILEGFKDHFFPFGIGPRKCIGEKMAKSELAIMIMRILIEFDFELLPGQSIIPFQSLTRVSKNGIKMKFTKR
jgi:cytochrome P450